MVQLGLDILLPIRGFFTLEKDLIDCTLSEIEDKLGYEKGRLKQGADFFILQPPSHTSDFVRMGTSVFPDHIFYNSKLFHAINSDEKKMEDLQKFKRKRLIKVVPLIIHLEAMKKFLTEAEYNLLRETKPFGKSARELETELKKLFAKNPTTVERIEKNFTKSKELYQRLDINDELYPSAIGSGVYQWKLINTVLSRCVCRMTDYTNDRYQKLF